jgi:hypothetical protein
MNVCLGYFYVLTIVGNAAINMEEQTCLAGPDFSFLGYKPRVYPEGDLLNHMVDLVLFF